MSDHARLTLGRWTWRAFIATTLVPLLVVELVLLGAYASVGIFNHRASVATLRNTARTQITGLAEAEARSLASGLKGVEQQVAIFAQRARRSLQEPANLTTAQLAQYETRPDGSYVLQPSDPNVASVFYSGVMPVGASERDKAHRTARLDPLMRDFVDQNPMVAQVYFNSFDSLNRIYPPVDVDDYPPKLDIPTYNFYYLADEKHNPERRVVWTDAYLDPAGAGWIISAVAPVYDGDRLEGVVGFDVTLGRLIDEVLGIDLPWGGYAVLVDQKGGLLALPALAEVDFGLRELVDHSYTGPVREDTPKPDAFSLFKRDKTRQLGEQVSVSDGGLAELELNGRRLVAWQKIKGPNWWLLLIVPQSTVYASADRIRDLKFRTGGILLIAVVFFCLVFVLVLYRRVRSQVALVTDPLDQLRTAIHGIVSGDHDQPPVRALIAEIDDIAQDVVAMGKTLGTHLLQLREQDDALRESAQREAAVKAAAEARTAFLAHVSHEIRTPMNGVIGTLDVLDMHGMSREQKEGIEVARRSAGALLGLIDDLLEAVRTQNDSFELEHTPFNLSTTISDVVSLFTPKASARGVDLVADIALPAPGAMGDPTRLRQILTNLVSNALKFTHEGEVRLRVRRSGDRVCFEVIDTGIGIPQERRDAIFDAFTQADTSTTRRFGGTGLGLTISAALVRRMGGALGVDSEVGKGSTFHFDILLPTKALPSGTSSSLARRTASRAAAALPSLRVLVAEDNSVNQKIVMRMLERLGHRPHVVNDGLEALEAATQANYDAIILDVHMPRLDGRATARRLRADSATAERPILGLTASVMPEEVRCSLDAGMDLVIGKPVTTATLSAALATLLQFKDSRKYVA
ncbi:MAG: ATP-binding protein [Myxococcota bacterium]